MTMASLMIGIEEVFVARIALGSSKTASSFRKTSILMDSSSATASMTS